MPSEFIKRQQNDFFRDLTSLGSLWFYLCIILFFVIFNNKAIVNKLLVGLVLMYFIAVIIKTFYFKERPNKYTYRSYIEKLDASSFPSLHSARIAFLNITLIGHFNNLFISILFVSLIMIVAYSRIYLQKHDLKDVIAGIVVGTGVYNMISYLF